MLKLKSVLLVTMLSSGMLFGASSVFASCGCNGPENCVCVQCVCPGCK